MVRKMHHMPQRDRDLKRPDRKPEQRQPRTEFIWDEKIGERKEKMMEKAEELKCIAPTEVMFAMAGMMDGFSQESKIYKPPTKKDFNEAWNKETAWSGPRSKHAQFDPEDGPKGSDWLRAVGVFKAAMKPGNNIPGVFDVKPPPPGTEDEEWNKFAGWCQDNYLEPVNLSLAAHRLQNVLGLRGREDIERLQKRMDDMKGADMDQVVVAGFINDPSTLRVDYNGTFHRVQDLERELDPEQQEREHEGRRAFIDKAISKYCIRIGDRWSIKSEYRHGYRDELGMHRDVDIKEIAREADKKFDEEHEWAPSPMISNRSAAYDHHPAACIIGLMEKRPPREGYFEEPSLYAHGVHPISMEIVKQFVGPDKIVSRDLGLKFNSQTGTVQDRRYMTLISENGIPLGTEHEEATGPEASEVFSQALASYTKDPSSLSYEWRKNLPFIEENHYKTGDGLRQLYGRTKGRAGKVIDTMKGSRGKEPKFNFEFWYKDNCFEAGDISTFAEAENHKDILTVQYEDLYPDQEQAIRHAKKYYPEKAEIKGREYKLSYSYDQDKDFQQAALILHINQAKDILEWKPEDMPVLGPEDDPLPITFRFNVRVGNIWQSHNRDFATTDLEFAQEALFQEEIKKEWEQAEGNDWIKKIEIEPGADWPDINVLVDADLKPFMTMPNGRELMPVPGFIYGTPDGGEGTGYYVKLFPSKFAGQTDPEAENARNIKEKRDKQKAGLEAAGPEKVRQAEEWKEKILSELEQHRPDDIFRNWYGEKVRQALAKARREMDDGKVDQAIASYEKGQQDYEELIQGRMERFRHAQALQEEYNGLVSQWDKIRWKELDDKTYLEDREREKKPKEPPARSRVEELIAQLEDRLRRIRPE